MKRGLLTFAQTEDRETADMQSGEEGCTLLRIPGTDGEAVVRCFRVFPGITLQYHDVHAKSCIVCPETDSGVFEIRHCREGRMEGSDAERFYYMEPGDLAVCRPETGLHCRYYPLGHYHGVTIAVNVGQAPRCLSCFLDDVNVRPQLLMQKFCSSHDAFVARSQPAVEHIFSELYAVPAEIRKGYFKVKVLELLLFLSCIDAGTGELSRRSCSNSQRELARQVCRYLTARMDSRITVEQLASRFHVSATQIKAGVKSVYGASLYSYIRMQKMESAAKLLRETDLSVSEIAGRYGYDNASKFAGAFKAVMGMAPKDYRNAPADGAFRHHEK